METKNERYEKQRRAAERDRERKGRLADPTYQKAQRKNAGASAERQRQRQRERQQEKRQQAAVAPKAVPVAMVRKKSTRGLKGRTPTAAEKRAMTALARLLSCVACALHGEDQPLISLHHIDGREKPGAHFMVIPLCRWHHQHAAPKEIRAIYPWLVPVHSDGSCGGKTAFAALNASEEDLLAIACERAGIVREAA
jgi:hypothetical protein